jgi:hypothetical protein
VKIVTTSYRSPYTWPVLGELSTPLQGAQDVVVTGDAPTRNRTWNLVIKSHWESATDGRVRTIKDTPYTPFPRTYPVTETHPKTSMQFLQKSLHLGGCT